MRDQESAGHVLPGERWKGRETGDGAGSAAALILAGGRGNHLYPLTRDRTKEVVPSGGIYQLIDFTLSNCLHSGLRRICVLPQCKFAPWSTREEARAVEERQSKGLSS